MSQRTDKADKYIKMFKRASVSRQDMYKYRKNQEEFYYNDVESTLSQFTKKQKAWVDSMYQIPISTKISYPIVEQMISFLTGTKPFPKLTATTDDQTFVKSYQDSYQGVWYESNTNKELMLAIRDCLVTGSGFLKVRNSSFFAEATFNVVQEHVPWREVFVDPYSEKMDFSDAEFICLAKALPISKAEKDYDIKIKTDTNYQGVGYDDIGIEFEVFYDLEESKHTKDRKLVVRREFFEKIELNVYISEKGDVGTKRPKNIEIPNPKKIVLGIQMEELNGMLEELKAKENELSQATENLRDAEKPDSETYNQDAALDMEAQKKKEEIGVQVERLDEALKKIEMQHAKEPEEIPAFEMVTERGSKVQALNIIRTKKNRIKRILMFNDDIYEEEYLPSGQYPLVHFCVQHNLSPNKTYGPIHYILDLVKALNKFWSAIIYDMQTNNHKKIMIAKGTVENIKSFETAWALPNATVEYIANPSLPNAGMPQIIEPSPMNQAYVQANQALMQLIEYVSGIYGVLRGDPQGIPETMGATQSLQNFGTQRIKLYGRSIESSLEDLALITITYLQKFAPRDKILKYFDEDGKEHTAEVMESTEDIKFNVRINIVNSMPTVRHMAAQLLAVVGAQTKNPYVADYLTQHMLKIMDLSEGSELAENIDVIKNMEQQLNELQEKLKEEQSLNKTMKYNERQKEMADQTDKLMAESHEKIALAEQSTLTNMEEGKLGQEEEEVPF